MPTRAAPAQPVLEQGEHSTELTEVAVGELVAGRLLSFPISDANGVLLVAAGAMINDDLTRRLRERGIQTVRVHPDDVANLTNQDDDWDANWDDGSASIVLDSDLVKELDSVLESGMLTIHNVGPAVCKSIAPQDKAPYSPAFRQKLTRQLNKTCESVSHMLREVLHGNNIDAVEITELCANSMTSLIEDTDQTLSVILEASRSELLAQQAVKSSLLAMGIGIGMGLDAVNVRNIGLIGMIQDWGMTRVPIEIRDLSRPLTELEFLEVKKHPIYSVDIMQKIHGLPAMAALATYQIHERPDGSGYPRGLDGKSIHLFARILQVADAYVAMISERPFRAPMLPYDAMTTLLQEAQVKRIDAAVVRALVSTLSLFPVGSYVTLTDGSICTVLRTNKNQPANPVVQLWRDHRGKLVDMHDSSTIIDLRLSEQNIVQALPAPANPT